MTHKKSLQKNTKNKLHCTAFSPQKLALSSPTPAENESFSEHGGPQGLEPTRYGDWEKNGRCTDF